MDRRRRRGFVLGWGFGTGTSARATRDVTERDTAKSSCPSVHSVPRRSNCRATYIRGRAGWPHPLTSDVVDTLLQRHRSIECKAIPILSGVHGCASCVTIWQRVVPLLPHFSTVTAPIANTLDANVDHSVARSRPWQACAAGALSSSTGEARAAAGEAIAQIAEASERRTRPRGGARPLHPRAAGGRCGELAGPHAKIPEWEQVLSAGAVCLNLIHAAHAFGYSGQWLSEWIAYDAECVRGARAPADEKVRRLHPHRHAAVHSAGPRSAVVGGGRDALRPRAELRRAGRGSTPRPRAMQRARTTPRPLRRS